MIEIEFGHHYPPLGIFATVRLLPRTNMAASSRHVSSHQPVFIKVKDMIAPQTVSVLDVCLAAEKVSGTDSVAGAQRIRGLWRVYPLTADARNKLLINGIDLNGQSLTPHDKNPYILPDTGRETPITRLYVQDLPISVSNDEIITLFDRIGCVRRSEITDERARNRDGKLTRFLTGRRFVYIEIPDKPLPQSVEVGPFKVSLYHKEMKQRNSTQYSIPKCGNCLQTGHRTVDCQNNVVCKACHKSGHKQAEGKCDQLMTEADENQVIRSEASQSTACKNPVTPAPLTVPVCEGSVTKPVQIVEQNLGLRLQKGKNLFERGRQEKKQTTVTSLLQRRHRSETPSKRLRSDSNSPSKSTSSQDEMTVPHTAEYHGPPLQPNHTAEMPVT